MRRGVLTDAEMLARFCSQDSVYFVLLKDNGGLLLL